MLAILATVVVVTVTWLLGIESLLVLVRLLESGSENVEALLGPVPGTTLVKVPVA